jgi:electron transfer flavoprotein alpha subunit
MSVLVFAQTSKGILKKNAIEAISYGAQVASILNTEVTLLAVGSATKEDLQIAGEYGISKVLHSNHANLNAFDAQIYTQLIINAINKTGATVLIVSHDATGKSVAPRISALLKAGLVSGAISLPTVSGDFSIKKNVFSGKAIAEYTINTEKKIISLLPNSVPTLHKQVSCEVEEFLGGVDAMNSHLKIETKTHDTSGEINLPEAELVVSAGRGMKGPENWGMIEDLAKTIGAATACSRPVSDIGWRPHHEHVGQTGIAIRPNLYIAVGISGAIQHLAGVNGSKVIVVVNKDAEAPFFKAADYGVVGDAFEIVPKLTAAFKQFKAQNS